MQSMTFGDAEDRQRLITVQCPGGSGSLRVAAALLLAADGNASVWVSDPTWNNHVPLLGGAGLELRPYPYYDTERHVIRTDAMLETLATVPRGSTVLFHACCHNPSGLDPDDETWRAITDIVVERELLPFIDMAYQGFARGPDEDAYAIRHMARHVPEMIVANSCSKNFGLYRDRVGSLSVLARDTKIAMRVKSQLSSIARTIYSMPPDHGAAVVATILGDAALRKLWMDELAMMRARILEMRSLLHAALERAAPDHDFSHLVRATGMFCFLGLSPEQVDRLKTDHGIYMVGSSRINAAGVTAANVDHLASAIAAVMG